MARYRRAISFLKRTDEDIDWDALVASVHEMPDDVFIIRFEIDVALHGRDFARWVVARRIEDLREAIERGDPDVIVITGGEWEEYRVEAVVHEGAFYVTGPLFSAMEMIDSKLPCPSPGEGGFARRHTWEQVSSPEPDPGGPEGTGLSL